MKTTAKWTVAAATAAAVAGMVAPQTAQAGLGLGVSERALSYEVLEHGQDGAWCLPAVVAVQSEEAWDAVMQDLAAQGSLMVLPAPAAPQVDWSKWTVVLLSMGGQTQRGAGLEVTAAKSAGRTLHLDVTLKAADGGLSSDPYMPYVVVALERKSGMKATKIQLHYTLQTPDGYVPAGDGLPIEVAVEYGTQEVSLTWGRLKADYR